MNPGIPAPRSNTSRMKLGPLLIDRSGNTNAIRITPFIFLIYFNTIAIQSYNIKYIIKKLCIGYTDITDSYTYPSQI